MELTYILASVAFFLFVIGFYLIRPFNYFQRRGIPTVRGSFPIIGHMLPVLIGEKNISSLCEGFYNESKEYSMCGFYQFFTPIHLIREPKIVKNVLLTNFSSFGQNPFTLNALKKDELFNLSPFFTKGDTWKKTRTPLKNYYSIMKLKVMMPHFQMVVAKMNNYLHKQSKDENGNIEINLKNLSNKFTSEVSATGLGIDAHNFEEELQPKDRETYIQLVSKLFNVPLTTQILQITLLLAPSLAKFLQISVIPETVDQYFRQFAKTTITNRKKENIIKNDFVQIIMDYQKSHNTEINELTLAASHMLLFAIDLYETTAHTLSFFIMDLARRPEIQDKVRQEIVTLLDKYNGELTYDALKEMTYFDKVLSESQRMNHVLGVFIKICTKRTKLEGSDGLPCVVEPGQTVAISAYGLQTDSKYWPEPKKFDPERFNEEEKNNREKFTFLPFGEGPRICVAMRMAIILMKLAVSVILKDFSIEPSSKMIFPLKRDESSFLNLPQGGFWINIKPL